MLQQISLSATVKKNNHHQQAKKEHFNQNNNFSKLHPQQIRILLHDNSIEVNQQHKKLMLQNHMKKQQILITNNLFNPYSYFGSSSHLNSIQKSNQYHQNNLQSMFQSKKCNSLRKEEKSKKKTVKKVINLQKQNNSPNIINNITKVDNKLQKIKIIKYHRDYCHSQLNTGLKSPQNSYKINENSRQLSSIRKKNNNQQTQTPSSNKVMTVNRSPKNHVRNYHDNYLKMNINQMQKIRLKLKINRK